MPVFELEIDLKKLKAGEKGAVKVLSDIADEADKVQKSSAKAEKGLVEMVKSIAGIAAAGIAVQQLNQMRAALVAAGSAAEETQNKFSVTFGTVIDDANAAVESLRNLYGMSREGAQASLAGIGDLLQGMGMTAEESLNLGMQVASLGTDLASFTNYAGGATGAIDALTKAMLGETEQAKMLGVVLYEDHLKKYAEDLGYVYTELTLAEKAQLRINMAIKQSPNAIGDFQRSMESYANQLRVTQAIQKDFIDTIGLSLVGAHAASLKAINENSNAFDELAKVIAGTVLIEVDKYEEWLDKTIKSSSDASTGIGVMATRFVQLSGGIKFTYNVVQALVGALHTMITAITTGNSILGHYVAGIQEAMTFDFSGFEEQFQKASDIGAQWVRDEIDFWGAQAEDINDSLNMIYNPETFIKSAMERQKAEQDASVVTRERSETNQAAIEAEIKKQNELKNLLEATRTLGLTAKDLKLEGIEAEYTRLLGILPENQKEIEAWRDSAIKSLNAKEITKGVSDARSALQSLQDAFAEVSMSEAEYAEFQLEKELAALRKELPNDIALIEAYGEARRNALKAESEAEKEEKAQENRQTQIDFYNEYIARGGDYADILTLQNEAIQKQIENWRGAGIPESYLSEMERLMALEIRTDWMAGIERGFLSVGASAKDLASTMEDSIVSASGIMSSALTDFATGGTKSFSDMINSMIQDLARLAIEMAMNQAVSNLFGGIGGLFGGTASTSGGGFFSSVSSAVSGVVGGYHDGGIIGKTPPTFTRFMPLSAFSDAPRLHSGGMFLPDERPAILQTGERVLNRQETRQYNAAQTQPVVVNVVNETNVPNTAIETTQSTDANKNVEVRNLIVSTVTSNVQQGGSIKQAFNAPAFQRIGR